MMNTIAKSTYLRIGEQKLNLVARSLVGLKPPIALAGLRNLPHKGAALIVPVLKQAVANAVNNYHLDKDSLKIKEIIVTRGPAFKRGQPISRGQWHPILKKTSHIKVILSGEPVAVKAKPSVKGVKRGSKS